MWKPTSIFISCLCVVDAFFVSYAVGLNSRQVLVVDTGLAQAGAQGQRQSTSTEVDKSQLSVVSPAVIPEQVATEPAQAFTDLGDTEERLQPSLKTAALAGILDPAQDKKFRPNDRVTLVIRNERGQEVARFTVDLATMR